MTTPPTTGYTPPAVDLTPFRVGTVWHHCGHAFMVTDMSVSETARIVRRLRFAEVRPGPIRVTFDLEEVDVFAEGTPQYRQLDGETYPGRVFFGTQAWHVISIEVVPGPAMRVSMYREPYEDRESLAERGQGEDPGAQQGQAEAGEGVVDDGPQT